MTDITEPSARSVLFISKATPGDDEFALWLAPRLEAAGYEVFADIVTLQAGTRWRKEITGTLQNRAVKMLLCCSDETLARDNVQEEIGIALDLVKEIPDPKFVIPLRLKPYKKIMGIGEVICRLRSRLGRRAGQTARHPCAAKSEGRSVKGKNKSELGGVSAKGRNPADE